jgi:hypothetical protein
LAAIDRSTTDLAIARDTPSVHLLHEFTSLRQLWVGGGDANTLERVSNFSSLEELALVGCRCELPQEFRLPNLRTLLLLDSPTVTRVEPLATLPQVEILGIAGCKKLQDYSPLGKLRGLRQLEIGIRRYYEKMSASSLSFLVSLKKLENLAVFFTSVVDGSIDAIGELARLRTLEISNTFSRESLARLAAKLPSTTCAWFQGWQSLGQCPKCDTESLAMMTGKGQRTLCRACQRERFETKLAEWRELVAAERRRA